MPGIRGTATTRKEREESTGDARKHYETEMQPDESCAGPQRGQRCGRVAETWWQWRKCGHSRLMERLQTISIECEEEEEVDIDLSVLWSWEEMATDIQETGSSNTLCRELMRQHDNEKDLCCEKEREPDVCEGLSRTPLKDMTTSEGSTTDCGLSSASRGTEGEAPGELGRSDGAKGRRGGLRPNPTPRPLAGPRRIVRRRIDCI